MSGLRKHLSGWVLILALASILPGHAALTPEEKALLAQPLPADLPWGPLPSFPPNAHKSLCLTITSFQDGLDLLGKISGKKIIFPEGLSLASWPTETAQNADDSFFIGTKDGKVGDVLERLCRILGVKWSYESAQNVIMVQPLWEREDSRSAKQLVEALAVLKVEPWGELVTDPELNQGGGHNQKLDPWRIAFDGLLSNPENFSSAGLLRLYHDIHGRGLIFSHGPAQNLFVGKMRDPGGRSVLLVLNTQPRISNKDNAGDLAYYLFDDEGRFLKGGVYGMAQGWEGEMIKAPATSDHEITIDIGWGSFSTSPAHVHFELVGGDFVLKGSTDARGKTRNAEETRQPFGRGENGGGLGILKYSVAGKPGP